MVLPARAPVKPRVISPETGDVILVEDILPQVARELNWIIQIVGPHGSGKTTALAHLAATAAADLDIAYLDDLSELSDETIAAAARSSAVVCAFQGRKPLAGALSYHLAAWGNDEWMEYLLAVHPNKCRSVMARLQAAPDRHLPRGLPELWRVVLDCMAEDESLRCVAVALLHDLHRRLPDAGQRTLAEQFSLADQAGLAAQAEKDCRALQRQSVDAGALRLLRHDAVRVTLAADRLARLLESNYYLQALEQRLPLDLVRLVAKLATPTAIQNLKSLLVKERMASHPMAASILHAADAKWNPSLLRRPNLAGAYLIGANWKGINLAAATIIECDLSGSDLTGAILNGAMASKANFARATLDRGSLIKTQAPEADFTMASLVSISGGSANFSRATFADADLTGARLIQTDLNLASLTRARLVQADLSYAILTKSHIEGADFTSSNLSWAILSGLTLRKAILAKAVFSHAFLEDCDLEGVELPTANFVEAHLQGARLTDSHMPGVDFTSADLRGARLAGIDWVGADLRKADMRACLFHLGSSRSGLVNSPIASEGSRTGFYTDEFDQQIYRTPEEIRKANLCGADLRDANLDKTDFYLVDLRGAKYTSAQFEHFRRCGAILFDRE
jgi:uncharacterized protein YjbI with pentapeptide repeats